MYPCFAFPVINFVYHPHHHYFSIQSFSLSFSYCIMYSCFASPILNFVYLPHHQYFFSSTLSLTILLVFPFSSSLLVPHRVLPSLTQPFTFPIPCYCPFAPFPSLNAVTLYTLHQLPRQGLTIFPSPILPLSSWIAPSPPPPPRILPFSWTFSHSSP